MNDDFDVIVVGAGMAGLACAGELVLHGKRPLLISETAEVASNVRSKWVGKNRGVMQHPVWCVGWDFGYWVPLIRALNVPVRAYPSLQIEVTLAGSGEFHDLPMCASAAALTDFILALSPLPLAEVRDSFEKVVEAGLSIPHRELLKMDRIPLEQWMADQGTDPTVSMLVLMLLGTINEMTLEEARELSVLGGWGVLRGLVCGEWVWHAVYPDVRDGLAIPLAKAIEHRGGKVSRGTRVAKVLTDGGKVGGVVLEDGTEFRAPLVAMATGPARIGQLLDPLPPEVQEPLAYAARFDNKDITLYTLLDRPVVPREREKYTGWIIRDEATGWIHPDTSNLQYSWPVHPFPWTTEPGKHFVASQRVYPVDKIEKAGGQEAIYEEMHEVNEQLYPGYKNAIEEVLPSSYRYYWFGPLTVGPKLPRTIDSVRGLWFVGDGSMPIGGIFLDGVVSAGVLGARAMVSAST